MRQNWPKKDHNSTSDWDAYMAQGATWALDPGDFVSAPSSVAITCPSGARPPHGRLISNLPDAQDMKEGRLITYHKISQIAAPGSVYFLYGSDTDPFVRSRSVQLTKTAAWYYSRFTWWNSYDLTNQAKLATRLDYWAAGAWVEGAISYVDRLTEAINRVGIGGGSGVFTVRQINFDDTEIWIV